MTEPVTQVTRRLAEFAAGPVPAAAPPAVLHQAKRCLLDWLGVGLAGSREPAPAIVREAAAVLAGSPDAWVFGSPRRVGAPFAALANGVAAHVLDYDDTYNPGLTTVHGSAPVWPAVMATAELAPTDGRTALASFVAGFETQIRVALAAGPGHYDVGWHVTGTVGHIGAAAAASRVLGLGPDQVVAALGTGATQAAGMKAVYGSMGKALHPGKAAMDGVVSAVLCRGGFTSSEVAIEGRRGFLQLFSPESDLARAVDGLGELWTLPDDGFKAYACGSLTHPCIDAAIALCQEYDLGPADIADIDLDVHDYVLTTTGLQEPATGLQGKFSIYHCVAVAIVDRAARLAQFTDDRVHDPDVLATRAKIRAHHDPAQTKDSAAVRLTLVDGTVLSRDVAHNKGTPGNPMSDDELEEKFLDLAGMVLDPSRARQLADLCWDLENVDDVTVLMAIASGGEGS